MTKKKVAAKKKTLSTKILRGVPSPKRKKPGRYSNAFKSKVLKRVNAGESPESLAMESTRMPSAQCIRNWMKASATTSPKKETIAQVARKTAQTFEPLLILTVNRRSSMRDLAGLVSFLRGHGDGPKVSPATLIKNMEEPRRLHVRTGDDGTSPRGSRDDVEESEEGLMKQWWYLSFAAEKFLGACIIEAEDFVDAVRRSHRMNINPGGSVRGNPIPEDAVYDPSYRNRLLTKEDLQAMLPHEEILTDRERLLKQQSEWLKSLN